MLNLPAFKENNKFAAAVSGGSDSLAMLFLLAEQGLSENLVVLHFNHKLRKESDVEAVFIQEICKKLNVKCVVGCWENPVLEGNLMQNARKARYDFFKKECEALGLDFVCVAHTRDDVVETFFTRLARGSGVQGLSAMKASVNVQGVQVVRPLLESSREELISYLQDKGQTFISDPSNENEKYFRIRMRHLKPQLEASGLEYQHVRQSALALRRADDALNFYAKRELEVYFEHHILKTEVTLLPEEIFSRVLDFCLQNVSGEGLSPRTSKRMAVLEKMKASEKKFTLGGVIFTLQKEGYSLKKE